MHISYKAPRHLGAAFDPILLSEVEQEQRPSGNGDREARQWELVFATVYTPHMLHIMIFSLSESHFFAGRTCITLDAIPKQAENGQTPPGCKIRKNL